MAAACTDRVSRLVAGKKVCCPSYLTFGMPDEEHKRVLQAFDTITGFVYDTPTGKPCPPGGCKRIKKQKVRIDRRVTVIPPRPDVLASSIDLDGGSEEFAPTAMVVFAGWRKEIDKALSPYVIPADVKKKYLEEIFIGMTARLMSTYGLAFFTENLVS